MNLAAAVLESSKFGAVVVGSGFGGTIAALHLANMFSKRNRGEKVCLLERGQWWISHELGYRAPDERVTSPAIPRNMREFLADAKQPYGLWAHPDNIEGMVDAASKAREISKAGLYDYRMLSDRIHVLAASGVGGGSLVYSNVTIRTPPEVYLQWPSEGGTDILAPFFDKAEKFIGVNKITTVAGVGPKNAKLEKSRVFQEAAKGVALDLKTVSNYDAADPDFGFAVPLSITDVPADTFSQISNNVAKSIPSPLAPPLTADVVTNGIPELKHFSDKAEQNVCQRQGRCNLGCLPGARHTLNKKLVSALQDPTLKDFLEVRALSEADFVEFVDPDRYMVHYLRRDPKTGQPIGRETVETGTLVLSAGTMGTNEILGRSVQKGLQLSGNLGKKFSPNGDLLGFMRISEPRTGPGETPLDITRGPINTCHASFKSKDKFAFTIEDTTLPKMGAPLFATLFDLYVGVKKKGSIRKRFVRRLSLIRRFRVLGLGVAIFGLDLPRLQSALTKLTGNFVDKMSNATSVGGPSSATEPLKRSFEQALDWLIKDHDAPLASPEERLSQYFVFSAMGLDRADGFLETGQDGKLKLKPDPDWFERNKETFNEIVRGMEQLAKRIDPNSPTVYTPSWNRNDPNDSSLVVLHPLGGASMGRTADDGVVNQFGQIFRNDPKNREKVYDNFYIMDGSIVPSALGVNSSLTIAALAFRCAEHLAGPM